MNKAVAAFRQDHGRKCRDGSGGARSNAEQQDKIIEINEEVCR